MILFLKILKIIIVLWIEMKTRFYQHQDLIELKIVDQNFHNLHQDPAAMLKKQARFSELNLLQQTHLQYIQMGLL